MMGRYFLQLVNLVIIFLALFWLNNAVVAQSLTPTTRNLLLQLKVDGRQNKNLAILFNEGEDRSNDLAKLLEDSDSIVRINAQIIIRYLNNSNGMNALFSNYEKNTVNIVGQIPVPLHAWDYEFVNSTLLDKPENFGQISTEYLYALALDKSPCSRKLLLELIKTAKLAKTDPFVINTVINENFGKSFRVEGSDDLAKIVLKNSTFLSDIAKKNSTAKIIAYNSDKSKSLIEIYVNYGVLAEETYHIVVSKTGDFWSIFSISQIAGS